MIVIDMRDWHLGNVAEPLDDCFLVDRKTAAQAWNLAKEALFNVDGRRATLVCEIRESIDTDV